MWFGLPHVLGRIKYVTKNKNTMTSIDTPTTATLLDTPTNDLCYATIAMCENVYNTEDECKDPNSHECKVCDAFYNKYDDDEDLCYEDSVRTASYSSDVVATSGFDRTNLPEPVYTRDELWPKLLEGKGIDAAKQNTKDHAFIPCTTDNDCKLIDGTRAGYCRYNEFLKVKNCSWFRRGGCKENRECASNKCFIKYPDKKTSAFNICDCQGSNKHCPSGQTCYQMTSKGRSYYECM